MSILSGILSGVATGASVGGPVGAVVGGALGGFMAQDQEIEQRRAMRTAKERKRQKLTSAAMAEALQRRQSQSLRGSMVNTQSQELQTPNAMPVGATPTQAVGNMGAVSSGTF